MRILVRVVLAVAGALILAPCASAPERAAVGVRGTAAPGWTMHRDHARRLVVRFPSDWHLARRSLTPLLADRVEVLSLATFPLGRGPVRRCSRGAEQALRDLGRDDAFLTLQERRRPVRHSGGRARLGPRTGPGWSRCAGLSVPAEERRSAFVLGGRRFSALVALGANVPAARRTQVERILASIRVVDGPVAAE